MERVCILFFFTSMVYGLGGQTPNGESSKL